MPRRSTLPILKSPREIEKMRRAGRVVAQVLHELGRMVAPGVTTRQLDQRAEQIIAASGGLALFKGYPNPAGPRFPVFPSVICASVNEVVVHGIPDDVPLREGDIVSVDCGVKLDGYVGDAARTFCVGQVTPEVAALVEDTRVSLEKAIEQCRVGRRLGDVSFAVQQYAESRGYGVVRDYCGHGLGQDMHEQPQVPNYGQAGRGERLAAGLCIAIEPMVNLGTWQVETLADGWSVVTRDRKPSAHWENSVAVTEEGPVILTSYD